MARVATATFYRTSEHEFVSLKSFFLLFFCFSFFLNAVKGTEGRGVGRHFIQTQTTQLKSDRLVDTLIFVMTKRVSDTMANDEDCRRPTVF